MYSIDLFSGVGGLSLGLEKAGFKTALAVEKYEDIAEGFKKNFPGVPCLVGDISKLELDAYAEATKRKKIDLIVGGPPCQGFSQKGQRKKLDDERNYLFKYFLDLVKYIKPNAFIIENVPGILSTSNGYFFDEIKNYMSESNYSISAKVLLASDYGVPQNRRRAFIVGILGNKKFEFPEPLDFKVSVSEAIDDLPELDAGQGKYMMAYTKQPKSSYQNMMREGAEYVYNHIATNHSRTALERLAMIPENGGKEHLPEEHLTKSIYSGTWTRLKANEQAATITTRFDTPSSGQFTLPKQDRCLTVREAARIQSFPDSFVFTGSKTNQMLQVGNAVPPLLAYAVGVSIKKHLESLSSKNKKLIAA